MKVSVRSKEGGSQRMKLPSCKAERFYHVLSSESEVAMGSMWC